MFVPVKHDVELIAFVLTPVFRVELSYRLHIKPGFSFQAVRDMSHLPAG